MSYLYYEALHYFPQVRSIHDGTLFELFIILLLRDFVRLPEQPTEVRLKLIFNFNTTAADSILCLHFSILN